MTSSMHVVIAGGGSPGHLYPGLAIAEALAEAVPGVSLMFAGTGRAFERHLVRSAGYNYVALPAKPAPHNPIEALRFVTDNVAGFWAARWMLGEQDTSLVVGLGGFASAPVVRAAVGRGIPTLLVEQNAVASRSTRWLSTMVETVCTGFKQTEAHLAASAHAVNTGIPARPKFVELFNRRERETTPSPAREKRIVVLGGSGGAQTLNRCMPEVIGRLQSELAGWRVVHQTGDGQLLETENRYGTQQTGVLTVSHIDELASLLFETDLVICRAGGTTLAELALAGVPAIVVPFPDAADNHQMANALVYQQAGACAIVDELSSGNRIVDLVTSELRLLVADHERRTEMAKAMHRLARPGAAASIAGECQAILTGTPQKMVA